MLSQIIKNLFTKISYSNNSGETTEEAIVILGAKNSEVGVDAEFKYISNIYGEENKDWVLEIQSLDYSENKQIDNIVIKLNSGKSITLYFDITDFFGK